MVLRPKVLASLVNNMAKNTANNAWAAYKIPTQSPAAPFAAATASGKPPIAVI